MLRADVIHPASPDGIATGVAIVIPEILWPAPPRDLTPAADEVHVFCARLDPLLFRLEKLAVMLSDDERRRAGRFHFEGDRNRYIAGRGQLREILGWLLQTDPARLIFTYSDLGKPRLAGSIDGRFLHFNLSHAGSLAVYAVACNLETGIDLEQVREIPDLEPILVRFAPESEMAQWRRLPAAQQLTVFFESWTRREAGLKLEGRGIGETLNQIENSFFPGEFTLTTGSAENRGESARCYFQSLQPAAGYISALAVKHCPARVTCWQWQK